MTELEYALLGLRHALDSPRRYDVWRRLVRNRMAGVKDALGAEEPRGGEPWLAARESVLLRERDALLRRLNELAPTVLDTPDVEVTRTELLRLVADVERHRHRVDDLVYESVSEELGGSE